MASSPGNANAGTNPQTQPYDIHGFFKPSSSPYPTPPSSYPPPTGPFLHHQPHLYMPPLPGVQQQNPQENAQLHQQRSLPYPTPPLNLPSPRANNAGTHILALLNNNNGNNPTTAYQDLPIQPEISRPLLFSGGSGGGSGPVRIGSCKLPKGRRLVGDNVTYDVDVRLQGEVQPQLEVTPITKYGSDPQLVVGRQIAVNRAYICYGLKGGNIRVLNINTALRSLFRGHTQRVTDMCFFAEDVHLLASVSLEGRVFVWRISEGSEGEDQPQITGQVVLAVQILGEENVKHPRICWHSHKQEILVVAIGKCVLRIDTTKVGKGEVFSADAPLKCPVDKLIVGVQLVGKHDGEVTDLSMCQWMTSRLASSSVDGTIKIWGDRKAEPLAVLRPHDGHPVNSATFLTAPERPDHIVLFTGGVLNREIKVWVSANEEGWLLPSDAESWKCVQTLDLKSSSEPLAEEAFFNQVVALSQAGILLLANAKKNAIYAVHIDYGSCPIQTSMDYIAEFTVTMPILSFTGTSDPPGDNFVKVYCVQTQAIQQYTLDLCLCLPPPLDNMSLDKSYSSISREDTATESFRVVDLAVVKTSEQPSADLVPDPSVQVSSSESGNALTYPLSSASIETTTSQGVPPNGLSRPSVLPSASSDTDTFNSSSAPHPPLPPIPVSPRLSRKLSGHQAQIESFEPAPRADDQNGKPPMTNYSIDRETATVESNLSTVPSLDNNVRSEEKGADHDASAVRNSPTIFKHPTHLVTPSEILMAASSADGTSSIEVKNDGNDNNHNVGGGTEGGTNVGVKGVGEARLIQNDEISYREESEGRALENKEKIFCSQASDLSTEMARECHAVTEKGYAVEDSSLHSQSSHAKEKGLDSISENTEFRESVSADSFLQSSTPSNKGKKPKDKHSPGSGLSSPSSSSINLAETSNEQGQISNPPYVESALPQISAMQEMLNQVLTSQREMQKQMSSIISNPVAKEGKRLEAALGRCIEKVVKANSDALWARFQEEIAKNEKSSRDRIQQVANLLTNLVNKDLNAMFEKVVKKEIAAIGPAVVRTISPTIEKTISSSIADSFQRGVGDKAINQLEKSVNTKLEATVARQIQSQFQTSGRQTLQEALKSSLEASIIPAFELSCKTMFEQIDTAFQKGIVEHTATSRQHFESAHSQLALTLREAINSASSVAQTLSRELTDGQRNLIALATSGANSAAMNPLVTQLNNGPSAGLHEKVEAPLDPTKELSRLISERKYEEAFTSALQRSDVNIVAWLCSQVDLHGLLSTVPLPLSQGVLLSLLQQLACDINKDTPRKLAWMTDVAAAINPADQMIMVHACPILEQVYHILHHQRSSLTLTGTDLSSIRLLVHVINSMLMSCK